ncbi:hypothetical protein BSKO_10493 [Bryopsis sp. KO-2023]|nr:hypothetical protein BSKO_10493 [Bryopsis sp. KO-2023]
MMASRGDVSILDTMVHFDVRGKEFSLPLNALELYPESYIAWLVRNNLDSVRAGKPISINRKPEAFKNLLENISKQSSMGRPSSPIDHGSSMPDPHTMSDIPKSLRDRMPNGGGHHPPPPPPPPHQKKGTMHHTHHSHSHIHSDPGHHHHHHSELSQKQGQHTHHSSFHSMQVAAQQQQQKQQQPPLHKLQHQNSSGRPKNPYEAFHGMHSRHARRPTTSASTYKGMDQHKAMEFETMTSSSEMHNSPKLPTGPTRLVAPKGTDEVVEDAVQEISNILRRYQKQHQLYDKALIVLSWGRNGEGDRVLRPQLSKLYDSMTGRVHDIRRSSDGSGSFERHGTSGWNTFDSVYSATCISSRVQTLVVEGLRAVGCAACFSEVKLDRNGVVDWRGSRRDLYPSHKFESATVRCLVVTLR